MSGLQRPEQLASALRLFELASVVLRFDRVSSGIVNVDHRLMCTAAKLRALNHG
jgi:hypothetical protein